MGWFTKCLAPLEMMQKTQCFIATTAVNTGRAKSQRVKFAAPRHSSAALSTVAELHSFGRNEYFTARISDIERCDHNSLRGIRLASIGH